MALGFGITITFNSGFCALITNVDWDGIERGEVDTSNHATTNNAMTFVPEALYDPGGLTVELLFNASTAPPITSDAETVTVTFRLPSGYTNKPNWSASGFLTKYKCGVPVKGNMTATANLKFSGPITFTAAS